MFDLGQAALPLKAKWSFFRSAYFRHLLRTDYIMHKSTEPGMRKRLEHHALLYTHGRVQVACEALWARHGEEEQTTPAAWSPGDTQVEATEHAEEVSEHRVCGIRRTQHPRMCSVEKNARSGDPRRHS